MGGVPSLLYLRYRCAQIYGILPSWVHSNAVDGSAAGGAFAIGDPVIDDTETVAFNNQRAAFVTERRFAVITGDVAGVDIT
jgi:hypothetical protein